VGEQGVEVVGVLGMAAAGEASVEGGVHVGDGAVDVELEGNVGVGVRWEGGRGGLKGVSGRESWTRAGGKGERLGEVRLSLTECGVVGAAPILSSTASAAALGIETSAVADVA